MLFAVAASAPQDVEIGGEDTRVGGAVGGAGWEVKLSGVGSWLLDSPIILMFCYERLGRCWKRNGRCYFPLNRAL